MIFLKKVTLHQNKANSPHSIKCQIRLNLDQIMYFDEILEEPEIIDETIAVKRIHVYVPNARTTSFSTSFLCSTLPYSVFSSEYDTCHGDDDDDNEDNYNNKNNTTLHEKEEELKNILFRSQGWVSLNGRTVEDSGPISRILKNPTLKKNYFNSDNISSFITFDDSNDCDDGVVNLDANRLIDLVLCNNANEKNRFIDLHCIDDDNRSGNILNDYNKNNHNNGRIQNFGSSRNNEIIEENKNSDDTNNSRSYRSDNCTDNNNDYRNNNTNFAHTNTKNKNDINAIRNEKNKNNGSTYKIKSKSNFSCHVENEIINSTRVIETNTNFVMLDLSASQEEKMVKFKKNEIGNFVTSSDTRNCNLNPSTQNRINPKVYGNTNPNNTNFNFSTNSNFALNSNWNNSYQKPDNPILAPKIIQKINPIMSKCPICDEIFRFDFSKSDIDGHIYICLNAM